MTRIRRAEENDCDAIAKVHTRSIRGLCSPFYRSEEIAAWVGLRNPDSYREVTRTRVVFVAEQDGEVVGFSQFDPDKGELEALYVLPEAGGGGLGAALLSRQEEEAFQRGSERMGLSSTLNAESFYARHGYRSLGPAKHQIPGGFVLDCVRMEKKLGR